MLKDEGVPKLIAVARTNRNPEVGKQAMLWLGQSNDPRALDFFSRCSRADEDLPFHSRGYSLLPVPFAPRLGRFAHRGGSKVTR
jgi:hypothetical protein